jgi:uncharacterized protein
LNNGLNSKVGCLAVINPEFSGKKVYEHLVNLGFSRIDFLLPDNHHDCLPKHPIEKYTQYLIETFDAWVLQDEVNISVRKFKSIILQLMGEPPLIYGFGQYQNGNLPLLSIRSDGSLSPTDELMSTDTKTVMFTGKNISSASLTEVLNCEIFKELSVLSQIAPQRCQSCCWYKACGGGALVNRFSKPNRFYNHSVYCDSLQNLFGRIASFLVKSGIPHETITRNLFNN